MASSKLTLKMQTVAGKIENVGESQIRLCEDKSKIIQIAMQTLGNML